MTAIVAVAVSGIIGLEYYTFKPEFCGLCHTIKKSDEFWAQSRHKDVKCVDCHYAPGKGSFLKTEFKRIRQVFINLTTDAEAEMVKNPLRVNDFGCATSKCHQKEKFPDRKAKFTEKVPLTHKPHQDRTIEAKILNCGTCHSYVKAETYFDVTEEPCYLCYGLNHIYEVYLNYFLRGGIDSSLLDAGF